MTGDSGAGCVVQSDEEKVVMIGLVREKEVDLCVLCHGPLAMCGWGVFFEGEGQGCGKALEIEPRLRLSVHVRRRRHHSWTQTSDIRSHSGCGTMQHDVPMEIVDLCLD
jgi:hypothetical protein